MARARGLRIPDELERDLEAEAKKSGKSWSAITKELLEEALRMRRAPGIVFGNGPSGKRAVVAGTGLDVWEVIATWKDCSEEMGKLRREYEWLSETQLRAALAYYRLYQAEIDRRLEREAEWTTDRVLNELPFAATAGR